MVNNDFGRLVESLTRDNEEKVYQMSMVRLVAEAAVSNLHEPDYFAQLCSNLTEIFNSCLCGYFWLRKRQPSGWVLDSWSIRYGEFHPIKELIPLEEAGVLRWLEKHDKPIYLSDVENEAIIEIWGDQMDKPKVALIPITLDESTAGTFVLIDPAIPLSHNKTLRLLEILDELIIGGVHNRELYTRLKQSEEEFRDLYENSSDMVVVVLPDGEIKDCNRTFQEKLKLDFNPSGMNIHEVILENHSEVFKANWHMLTNGNDVNNVDILAQCWDKTPIEMELSGNARYDAEGTIDLIRIYLHDVTEKRRGERDKRELEMRMKLMRQRELAQLGLYVSGIVHNLQNPIHVVKGYLQILRMKGVDIPELEKIEQSTENITEIINNLLDKVKRERNPKTTDVDINELLKCELAFLNANDYFKTQVEKDFNFDDQVPPIKGIYGDFSQAIMNIVYNALDAMRESPRKVLGIKTEFNIDENKVIIKISDTGTGISEDIKDYIFTPFFTTKSNGKVNQSELISGSGLGLSTSIALLDPYNGRIDFATAKDQGATFFITLNPALEKGE